MVDTNVAVTANGPNHMSLECTVACQKALKQLMDSGKLLLDDQWEMLTEYNKNLNLNKQGMGDVFLKWVLTNQANPARVEMVSVTPELDSSGRPSYNEFPDDNGLVDFDHDDRVFVAVAAAHSDSPPILQATDSKWLGLWDVALINAGIKVEYLCRHELQQIFDNKFEI